MCPDRQILSAYLDGEVQAPWAAVVEQHIEGCEDCRRALGRMEEGRRILLSEDPPNWRAPMERVHMRLLAQSGRHRFAIPFWKRSLSVPLPLAAIVATLVLLLAVSLTVALLRSNIGLVRITKAPAGGTEIQIAAPVGNLETLLKSIDTQSSSEYDVITLPKKFHLMPVGEPLMGKEAEFLRKKTW
jgi:anti-sigma factor RsiW